MKNIFKHIVLSMLLCTCIITTSKADGRGRGVGGFFAGLGVGAVLGGGAPYYAYDPYYDPYYPGWRYPRYRGYNRYDYDYYNDYESADDRHNYYSQYRPKN